MFNKKELLKEEKDCASMLGMSLQEYRNYCNNTKVFNQKTKKLKKYDDSILTKLGLSASDLKLRKVD